MTLARRLLESTAAEFDTELAKAEQRVAELRHSRAAIAQALDELEELEGELSDHDEERAAASRGPRG